MTAWPEPHPDDRIAAPSGSCVVERCCQHPLSTRLHRAPRIGPARAGDDLVRVGRRIGELMGERE